MDLDQVLWFQIIIFLIFGVVYLFLVTKKSASQRYEKYSSPDWNYEIKKVWARYKIKKWKKTRKNKNEDSHEKPKFISDYESCDTQKIWGANSKGNSIYITFRRRMNRTAEVALIMKMSDGAMYRLPNQPDTMVFDGSSQTWNAGNLRLVQVEPYTRWRIIFNGIMAKGCTEECSDQDKETMHVKINLVWIAATDPFRVPDDCSNSLIAGSLAVEPWKGPDWMDGIINHPVNGYDQYGNFIGTVSINDCEESVVLSGIRQRRWGATDSSFVERSLHLMGMTTDGTYYNIEVESNKIGLSNYQHGSIRLPDCQVKAIDWMDIEIAEIGEYKTDVRKAFTIKFKSGDKYFTSLIHLEKNNTNLLRGGRPWNWESIVIPAQLGINSYQGYGLLEIWYNYNGPCPLEPAPEIKTLRWRDIKSTPCEKYCLFFNERPTCCPQLVGAKGASLALLSSIRTDEYDVPNGFCLTIKALEAQLAHNPHLKKSLDGIKEINQNYSETELKQACQKTVDLFLETSLCDAVKDEIQIYFKDLCEAEALDENKYFAVRSSGIGEDSEELSAAGQNSTILGCKSIEDILKAVQKCWSSLFMFQSVEYRRQHGQVLECGMGVVIQKMIESESAGVMFTRHPTTGDPSCILITSNFGLGETVVSGEVEPDTIYIKRDLNNNLSINQVEIGKKAFKITGDTKVPLNEESKTLSISNEMSLALGKIAIIQESLWGAPRDIEWAISKGKIYLVQARPITSLNNWTEQELLHELNSAVMSDDDIQTFANTGEVLPNVLSPLAHSTIVKALDDSISMAAYGNITKYALASISSTHYRISLNYANTFARGFDKEISFATKVMDTAIFGHLVTDEKLHGIGIHRFGPASAIRQTIDLSSMFYQLLTSSKAVKSAKKIVDDINLDLDSCDSSIEMYDKICNALPILIEMATEHNYTSSASFFSQFIFFMVLIKGKNGFLFCIFVEFTVENYTDIGTVLSSCNDVISADIPSSLSKLSKSIHATNKVEEFCKQDPKDGMEWLEKNSPESLQLLHDFLKKHGHRSIREFDFEVEPWGLDPSKLITTIQTTLKSPLNENVHSNSNVDLISKLVTPMEFLTKLFLKLIIPTCQKAVARRESTKSSFILLIHKFRIAYRKLATQMMKEWMLPDLKLIFFITHSELGRYLHTRDPCYINKAMLRRRYFPKWDTYRFPEIMLGFPQPINLIENALINDSDDAVATGTPVFPGNITGRACVVQDLSKIGELKSGDILITHATDIGWSPYFPLLGGVVTELGGLISHGAVVAREYGLPCIVGVQSATSLFKTGDTVLLNSSKGILKKVTV